MRTFRPAFPNKDDVPVVSAAAAEGNVTLPTALTGPAGVHSGMRSREGTG